MLFVCFPFLSHVNTFLQQGICSDGEMGVGAKRDTQANKQRETERERESGRRTRTSKTER